MLVSVGDGEEGEDTSLIKQNMIQNALYSFIMENLFHKRAKKIKKTPSDVHFSLPRFPV